MYHIYMDFFENVVMTILYTNSLHRGQDLIEHLVKNFRRTGAFLNVNNAMLPLTAEEQLRHDKIERFPNNTNSSKVLDHDYVTRKLHRKIGQHFRR